MNEYTLGLTCGKCDKPKTECLCPGPLVLKKGDTMHVDFFSSFLVDMNDTNVRCGNCRFWLPHDLAPTCLGGECHRLSPLCKFEGMNTPAYWPETEPDQKCGEFSPRLIGSVVTGCPSCRTPVPKSSSPIPPPDLANKP